LEGLHAAHVASLAGQQLNIVHRDVSPQNIMVGADGNTRVLDFGIAQAALRSQATAAGKIKGKVAYMSPEQVQGHAVDARTDVFAAGVVLWEALTGRRLFFAADSRETVDLLLNSPIPAPSSINADLPPELDAVVLKALERHPGRRFQSAHDFGAALHEVAEEGSRREVATWVSGLAEAALAHRLELLQALEASAVHTQVAVPLPVVTASSPHAAAPPHEEARQGGTQATTSTSILPQAAPSRWRRRAPWLFAAAGVMSAVLVWRFAAQPSLTRQGALPTAQPASASAPPAPSVAAPAAPSPTANDVPVVSADSMPLSPAPSAARSATAKKPASARPAAGRGNPCNPPYRIDASGVRRIKPECL
ncbi:MAG TPA: serine/threonine-protein kinase, partial [Polyangiaceae bacterium]|nr:serine/threonine-protein kinase [Polyangiaceae bacterium]